MKRQNTKISLHQQKCYWHQKLGGLLPALEVPADHPRANLIGQNIGLVKSSRKVTKEIVIDNNLYKKLNEFCSCENVTLSVLLIATFKLFLLRYTQQEDIILSSLGVKQEKIFPLILRTNLNVNLSCQELLQSVAQTVSEAIENKDYPLEDFIKELSKDEKSPSGSIFQVMLVLNNIKFELSEIPLEVKSLANIKYTNGCELILVVAEEKENLKIKFEYQDNLFELASIKQMLSHFEMSLT